MGRDSEDKAGRILSIYTRLKQGKVIYKQEESIRYGVAARTIQRDITDMQCFLQEQSSLFGEIQEIVYDKTATFFIQMGCFCQNGSLQLLKKWIVHQQRIPGFQISITGWSVFFTIIFSTKPRHCFTFFL